MNRLWVVIAFSAVTAVAAQQAQEIWGTLFVSAPALSDRQQAIWRSNSAGKLVTDIVTGSCSNSLDFSDGCNSQYLPLLPGV